MDLFDDADSDQVAATVAAAQLADAPLAARMRPAALNEIVGQSHLLGPGRPLRLAIERDQLRSAIFYGPPGCGKSTLASVIARTTSAAFANFSAVTGGVADVRKLIDAAKDLRRIRNKRTLLFVDEIHRFNRAQQDAFLPHVEDGTIVLIGATTENPYFAVNAPLLSRARVFAFTAITADDIAEVITRALTDTECGLGERGLSISADALTYLSAACNGDARTALGGLETAADYVEAPATEITLSDVEAALGQRAIGYDKSGDAHYDTISAFIKSIRGSDPDAAVYYLARMLEAGEDPRFIARRLVILASEDIGCADVSSLPLAMAAFQATQTIGMPECALTLSHVTLWLALAPKSNAATKAIGAATSAVKQLDFSGVPKHIRDAHYKGAKALGHGTGYIYPHDVPGGYAVQQYLPDSVLGHQFYEPTRHGVEAKLADRLAKLRGETPESQASDEAAAQRS